MPAVRLTIDAGRVLGRMDTMLRRVPGAVKESLLIEARVIYEMSQRVVPQESSMSPHFRGARASTSGALKQSGEIIDDVPGQVTIAYGRAGVASEYALAVHEHLSQHSPYSWRVAEARKQKRDRRRPEAKKRRMGVKFYKPGTGPKYLESPFKKRMSGYEGRLAKHLRVRLMK